VIAKQNKTINMKTIKVRKSSDFSENSKVYLHIGGKRVHIRGLESLSFPISPGEELYASQQWTRSNKISYDQIVDQSVLVIKPRLGKLFAFINLVILLICFAIFYFTHSRWSFFLLLPSVVIIGIYVTILKDRYLKIESYKIELFNN
jgi:hypothetical protein